MRYARSRSLTLTARLLLAGLLIIVLAACEWSELVDGDSNDDDGGADGTPPATQTNVPGFSVAISGDDFDTTEAALDTRLARVTNDRTTVDHQANAAGTGLRLRPTTVFLFGLPNRTSPLIAADARAALDLPPRMLAYRDGDGRVAVAYTNADYLDARYDLDGAEAGALSGLDGDLQTIASDVTGDDPSAGAASGIGEGEGIELVDSRNDFATTVNALADAIGDREALTLLRTIDFQARANQAGRTLDPSTLFIFGNPDAGTPLMRASQTAGIDLPQKMLVSADADSNVTVYYNDPGFIADRHDIDDRDEQIRVIARVLCELAAEATGRSGAGCGNAGAVSNDTSTNDDASPGADDSAGASNGNDTGTAGMAAGNDSNTGAANEPAAPGAGAGSTTNGR